MKVETGSRTGKAGLLLVVLLIGVLAAESVFAHGRRGRSSVSFGVFVGAPAFAYSWHARPFSPFYYPPAYYYPPVYAPPVVISPAPPPVYIEQSVPQQQMYPQAAPQVPQQAAPQPAPQTAWWYYCADTQAYYPYVRECPGGWQRVSPQPPS